MHIISKSAFPPFWNTHPAAQGPLDVWHKLAKGGRYTSFVDLKKTFGSAGNLAPYTVFDIAGNNCRIVSIIHYDKQRLYIRHVFTHREYDRWSVLYRSGKA